MAVGLGSLGASWAQNNGLDVTANDPYYIGAGIGITHDSNVLRQSNNGPSDSFTSASLLGGLNKNLGRQRLYLDGNVSDNRYSEFKSLNNTSYGLNTGLDWSTVGSLSGNIRYGVTQDLANRPIANVPSTNSNNSEKTQLVSATARYGLSRRLALEGGLQHRSIDYSQPQYASLENTQNVVSAGVVYGLTGLLTMGVGLRSSTTDTPQYSTLGGDKADRNDVDFTVNWSPSGLSTIAGRLSLSREDHSRATASNFSGPTGSLSWDYRPTGRLRFNTSIVRDTGTEARFVGYVGGETPIGTESYRLTTTTQVGATYAVTGKIDSTLTLSHVKGSLISSNVSSGEDTLNTYALSATYKATRSVSLKCTVGRETRSTASALSSSYEANTFACLANFILR